MFSEVGSGIPYLVPHLFLLSYDQTPLEPPVSPQLCSAFLVSQ